MAILGHFGALWRPPMALPDPRKGSSTLPWVCQDLIKVWSMLFYQIVGTRPAYGPKMTIYGHFRPFWGPMAPPDGPSRPKKRFQHIVLGVPDLIEVWSMLFYQFVGARPAFGPKITIYGNFRPIWGPSGSPRGPKRGPRHKKRWAHQLTTITKTIAIIYKV